VIVLSQLFEGKVVFITGAASGQGRAHSVRFAEEDADLIAFDLCDLDQLKASVANGVAEFGRIDFVLANAGILTGVGQQRRDVTTFVDAFGVVLNGVYFTIEAAFPAMIRHGEGGAIVITSTAAGLKSISPGFETISAGAAGYTAAKLVSWG
jgi:NAD(P)-dependent dehydrogenase (short-subunit alcohol dehydrogenase family)